MMSIAGSALADRPTSKVTLLYANRTSDSIMFKDRLDALKDAHLTRFVLAHILDEEIQDVELVNGRLDREKLAAFARAGVIRPKAHDAVYICGPQPMMDEAAKAMGDLGVEPEKIHFERFTPPGGTLPTASASDAAIRAARDGVLIEVILDGARRRFRLTEEDGTVLSAAKRAGLDLPYSCAGGMCCTCRCRVLEGRCEMIQNYSSSLGSSKPASPSPAKRDRPPTNCCWTSTRADGEPCRRGMAPRLSKLSSTDVAPSRSGLSASARFEGPKASSRSFLPLETLWLIAFMALLTALTRVKRSW